MAANDVHTVPWNGRWTNKREFQKETFELYCLQKDAIRFGRRMAKTTKSEHFIHGRDGAVRMRTSYGHAPHLPKG